MPEEKKESRFRSFLKRSVGFALGVVASPFVALYLYATNDLPDNDSEINTPFKKGLLQGASTGIGAIGGFLVGGPVGAIAGAVIGFGSGTALASIKPKKSQSSTSLQSPTNSKQLVQKTKTIQQQRRARSQSQGRSTTPSSPPRQSFQPQRYPETPQHIFDRPQPVSNRYLPTPATPRSTNSTAHQRGGGRTK